MKRNLWIALFTVVAVVAFSVWRSVRTVPVEVDVATVEQGDIVASVSNTRAGTVNTCNRARISPMVSGQIAALRVQPGDRAERGQVLLELWNEDARAQLRLAETEKTTAIAQAEEACTSARVSQREAKRFRELLRQKMVSDEQADLIIGKANAQSAGCRAMQNMIAVSDANIALAQAYLNRTILFAPFSGVVAEVNGEVGEVVTPSPVGVVTQPAIDLIDDSCTYVSAPIDEVDTRHIRSGMSANISLDAFPGEQYSGTVRRVAPYVLDLEKQARTVEIEVEFDNPTADLLPGYSADVEVILDRHRETLKIPSQALLDNNTVFTINADGQIKQQTVRTGLQNWQETEITHGLTQGDTLVLSVDRDGVVDGASVVATVK